MVFDLHRALVKKEEFESARLDDFAFRLRVRTMRELAAETGQDPEALIRLAIAHGDDMLAAALAPISPEQLLAAEARARRQLISELGDPSPYRLG